ncbi:glutaredoxin [Candidatus Marinamargulisbacteria bacterium SCGC AAA071-K20]|nr:glutaredoxin [Candidatus Marinamargulisbacteria bacterium SCGC AAA071-K20]
MINKEDLTLYHFASCPYCVRVRRHLLEDAIQIREKDILVDPSARQELMDIGGKTQVPCLVIDGEPMYESADIVKWFEINKDKIQ